MNLSLLDRLIDNKPDSMQDAMVSSWEERREYIDSICRDLTALLNTRRADEDFDPTFEEATNSLLTFGIADFTSLNLKNESDQERVRRSIERSIRRFEPRLVRVSVSMDEVDAVRPLLRFQITAMLRSDPGAESLIFDAALHRESRSIAITQGK